MLSKKRVLGSSVAKVPMTRVDVGIAEPDRTGVNPTGAAPIHWPSARIVVYTVYRTLVPTREFDRACGKLGASDEQLELLD